MKKGIPAAPAPAQPATAAPAPDAPKEPEVIRLPAAEYEDLARLRQEWDALVAGIAGEDPPCGKVLKGTRPEPIRQGILSVVFFDRENYNRSKAFGALELVKEKAAALLGKNFEVEARLVEEAEPEPVYERITDEEISSMFDGIPLDIEDLPE